MALLSPGVQVSVIDQSNYTPAAASSTPYILLVTAENKIYDDNYNDFIVEQAISLKNDLLKICKDLEELYKHGIFLAEKTKKKAIKNR